MVSVTTPELHSFAVYPAALDEPLFDPFVLDVPVITHVGRPSEEAHDAAARRAWWSAFSYLQRQGPVEPEDFVVHEWTGEQDGRLVGSGGIVKEEL